MLDGAKNKKCLQSCNSCRFCGLPSASGAAHLSKKYGFRVIIDSAHGIGSKIGADPTGAILIQTLLFSFHAIKL